MTELEYVLVTNKTALMAINDALRSILPHHRGAWGITTEQHKLLCKISNEALDATFGKIKTNTKE